MCFLYRLFAANSASCSTSWLSDLVSLRIKWRGQGAWPTVTEPLSVFYKQPVPRMSSALLPVSLYNRRHWFYSASAYCNLHVECLLSQRLSKLPTELDQVTRKCGACQLTPTGPATAASHLCQPSDSPRILQMGIRSIVGYDFL